MKSRKNLKMINKNDDNHRLRATKDEDDEEDTYWEDWCRESEKSYYDSTSNNDASQENSSAKTKHDTSSSTEKPVIIGTPLKDNSKKIESESSVTLTEEEEGEEAPATSSGSEKRKAKERGENLAVQKKAKGNSGKINVDNGPEPPPPLPIQFRNEILRLANGGAVQPEKLVIQKMLYKSDIDDHQNRLNIPWKQMKDEFLTKQEKIHLLDRGDKGQEMPSMTVKVIDPSLCESSIKLRVRELQKKRGVSSSMLYVLNGSWTRLCRQNQLTVGTVVQLWAIRVDGDLWFAIVRLPPRQ